MREVCDMINTDGDEGINREEWIRYFCPEREAVAQASRWDPNSAECRKITGYIFDCDGTIYQPSGMIPGAEDVLTMLERSGCQVRPNLTLPLSLNPALTRARTPTPTPNPNDNPNRSPSPSPNQYALLSNTGAKPHSAVQEKLASGLFECQPGASPLTTGRTYPKP